ncbi:hypothetical protein, partial [Salmonella enterica]
IFSSDSESEGFYAETRRQTQRRKEHTEVCD